MMILRTLGLGLLYIALCSFWPFSSSSSTVKIKLKTDMHTNGGTPFYVFIKESEKTEFLKNEYQMVVREAFPTDDQVAETHPRVIFPGRNYKIKQELDNPEAPLALYFLFTDPGGEWKTLVQSAKKVEVVLGNREILRRNVR